MSLLDTQLPLVAAPMAGGPTTMTLARAVASAGGFPFLAGGYQTAESLGAQLDEIADLGTPFGVNLFTPTSHAPAPLVLRNYAHALEPEARAYGVQLDSSVPSDDDGWDVKLELLISRPVPVVSFTFGLPSNTQILALQRAGSIVLASVTTPEEARAAREAGVDGLIAQASGAGGHSATFDAARTIAPIDGAELVAAIRAVVRLPVIAAGGVDGSAAVSRLLRAGAEAVAVGTLLLRTDEAGTSSTHRAALADARFTETVVTRAFTGRPARALRNGFIDRHSSQAPVGYPAIHHLTRPIRQAASAAGDADRLHLWAGTGWQSAASGPAADVIRSLTMELGA